MASGPISGAQSELGPALPPRCEVYAKAVELQVLARRAIYFSCPGPKVDLPLALKQLDAARALLGEGGGDG